MMRVRLLKRSECGINKKPVDDKLFFCPEEGCIKSYQQYSSFENHLTCGRHKYALENMTLYDKAMTMYATKLEEGISKVTALDQDLPTEGENISASSVPLMGWALKAAAKRKRFSETQRKYLTDVFVTGEATTDGTRTFNKDHFLTSQQISGFFSRLARKKALHSNDSARNDKSDDEDDLDVNDQEIHELADKLNNAIGLKHPIVSGAFNICELSKKSSSLDFQ